MCPEQAADIVRIVGIGRNEYIATMNKCKAKKLLWRMNKAVVREHLPTEPLELTKQTWWTAHVVNLGEPFELLRTPELRVILFCSIIIVDEAWDRNRCFLQRRLLTACSCKPLLAPDSVKREFFAAWLACTSRSPCHTTCCSTAIGIPGMMHVSRSVRVPICASQPRLIQHMPPIISVSTFQKIQTLRCTLWNRQIWVLNPQGPKC